MYIYTYIFIYIYIYIYIVNVVCDYMVDSNCLIKLPDLLEKPLKKISRKKMKKLQELSWNSIIKDNASTRFQENLNIFTFFNDFSCIPIIFLQTF